MATFDVSEEYDFVEQPPEEYFCPVSFAVLLEPYQTQCCGNHLSQKAYRRLQGQPCPVCREDNLTAMKDKFHKRKVMSLRVRCPHKAEGCKLEGELGNLEQHVKGCQYAAVLCPNIRINRYYRLLCNERVQRRNLEEHMSHHCPLRPFTCQYCNHKATYQEVTKEHWPVCEKYPLPCPNECGEEEIERQHLKKHLEQTCQLEVIKCEFNYTGCGAQLQRRLMSAHMKENMEAHLLMMMQDVQQERKRNCQLEDCIKQQADQIKQQGYQIKQQGDQIKQQGYQIKQQGYQIQQQGDEIQQQGDEIQQQGDEIQQQRERIGALLKVPPVYVVIDEFRELRQDDDIWYSPPFYSHLGGYKMCLSVDANGYGDGKGTHVSVFVYLMRGEFDDDLQWPFCGDITVELHHQQSAHKTITEVISMRQYNSSTEARQRPIADMNESAQGLHCYISHKEVHTEGYNYCNTLKFCVSQVSLT